MTKMTNYRMKKKNVQHVYSAREIMQSETALRCHFTAVTLVALREKKIVSSGKSAEKEGHSHAEGARNGLSILQSRTEVSQKDKVDSWLSTQLHTNRYADGYMDVLNMAQQNTARLLQNRKPFH